MAAVTQPVVAPETAPEAEVAPSSELTMLPAAFTPAVLPAAAMAAQAEPEAEPQAEQAPAPIADLRRVASGRNARIMVRTQTSVSGVSSNDPLTATLSDILGGWGDLSPEDMKRLELFRPERLVAAVAAFELPKSKSGEAKARLSQLRQYSGDLERRALDEQAAAAPAIEADPPMVATTQSLTEETAAGEADAAANAPSNGAAAGLATAIALRTATRTGADPSVDDPSMETGLETAAVLAVVADAAADAPPESELDELASYWAEPRSVWAEPRSVWKSDEEAQFQELPAPSYEEIEVRHEIRPSGETLSDAEPAGSALTSAEEFFWDETPADPLSRLSIKVETAEELLALPPQEQADMTAFLGPSELAATFRATEDPQLKKAVIDTLEHIGSPASLNALGNCFEDDDCDVQRYALEAADRLLGVA